MCEIQFVKRVDGKNLSEKDLHTFIKFMSLGDIGNSDAFGFFNDEKCFRSEGKFNYRKLNSQDIMSSNFIVGHNRFATNKFYSYEDENEWEINMKNNMKKGTFIQNNFYFYNDLYPFGEFICNKIHIVPKNPKGSKNKNKESESKSEKITYKFNDDLNNHPFELNDLTLVHNGVIQNAENLMEELKVDTKISTDSFVVLFLINKFLKESESKNKKRNRTSLIVDAIKKTTNLIGGWYSIFLFDKKEKNLYYFKDNLSVFYFYKPNKEIIVGSTMYSNFERVYKDKKSSMELITPKPGKIYLVNGGGSKKSFLQEVGVFREYIKRRKVRKEAKGERESIFSRFQILQRMFSIKLKGGKKKR